MSAALLCVACNGPEPDFRVEALRPPSEGSATPTPFGDDERRVDLAADIPEDLLILDGEPLAPYMPDEYPAAELPTPRDVLYQAVASGNALPVRFVARATETVPDGVLLVGEDQNGDELEVFFPSMSGCHGVSRPAVGDDVVLLLDGNRVVGRRAPVYLGSGSAFGVVPAVGDEAEYPWGAEPIASLTGLAAAIRGAL